MITQYIEPDFQIMILGCGNSNMTEDMYNDGYTKLTNVDFSNTVIKQQTEKYKEKIPSLAFKSMDAKALSYGNASFDAIIDKACFDAILCGKDAKENSETFLNEIHRVLNANGVYVCVTFGHPESRLPHFSKKEYEWTVFTQKVPKPAISKDVVVAAKESDDNDNYHFVYIMRKRPAIKD